ncbi:hypothetical protein F8S09_05270 [Deinococcus sp. SDU3-2]|uniref:Uncharacterized protein n=1 Tax=Deinococcus terrestris TaxID=2651870 RepID=A0A7X1NUW0_9DEIO|nr:hypothetical protein [Deinococcus terrestris]MPY66108.1 hypothetical protein [Deinococcus terrestris]
MTHRSAVLLAATGGFLAACLLWAVLIAPRAQMVARWDAPDGLHHALILDDGPDLTSLFGSVRRWRLYLGREAESPSYGHFVPLPDLPGVDRTNWQQSRVVWFPAGVRFTFPTGHELYVPARAYQGGR